jgi:molybdopterin converting factor small subunit
MQVALYAMLRQKAGTKYVDVVLPPGSTIRELMADLIRQYPDLREYFVSEDGGYRGLVRVFVNDVDIRRLHGVETLLGPADRVDMFTPVSGG